MSNDAYLYSTENHIQDAPAGLKASRPDRYVAVGESANRIPIPWLCCFRQTDLVPMEVLSQVGPTDYERLHLMLPCVSISGARSNLESSLWIFEAICSDQAIAHEYWRLALDGFESMPLAFLTIKPIEVLQLNDLAEEAVFFARCFTGQPDSIPCIKRLSFYQDGYVPYTVSQFYSAEGMDHVARMDNSAALDPAYVSRDFRREYEGQVFQRAVSEIERKRWWQFWGPR